MPKSKRAYIPKVKGCYECSQRRIHCDRGVPTCAKCASKGIQCSGYGVRYRFNNDVVSRVKNSDSRDTTPQVSGLNSNPTSSEHGATKVTEIPHPKSDQSEHTLRLADEYEGPSCSLDPKTECYPTDLDTELDYICETMNDNEVNDYEDAGLRDINDASNELDLLDDADEMIDRWAVFDTLESSPEEDSMLVTVPHVLAPWKQYFLMYYGDKVAAEMVSIDDQHNGWRHLILPIAHSDDLVRDAVLATSAFHFAANTGDHLITPNVVYHQAIGKLRKRQDLNSQDIVGKQSVLLALVVLLTTSMVSGNSDFRILFHLLRTGLAAAGGEEVLVGDLGIFLRRQIRKLRAYASPHISQIEAVDTMNRTAAIRPSTSDGWECFRSYYYAYPNFETSMQLVYDLNEQACDIYVKRALAGNSGPPLTELVDKFISNLKMLPANAPCEHTLVWATFIAALESSTPEQQQFFTDNLLKHYNRNGFVNLLMALEHLKLIWAQQDQSRDWTQYMAEMPVFVV